MFLMISDRGAHSLEHLVQLHNTGYSASLCPGQWKKTTVPSMTPTSTSWTGNRQPASCLLEQQRRRATKIQTMPHEHYEIAVLRHQLIDPATKKKIRGFASSSSTAATTRCECRQRRQENITKIHTGLAALQAKLLRGHPQCTTVSVTRQVVRLLGKKEAARYFTWQFVPLTPAEQQALPPPLKGHRRAHTPSSNSLSTPLPPKPRNNMTAHPCS